MNTDNWRPTDGKKCGSIFIEDIDRECHQHCKALVLCCLAKSMECMGLSKEELERRRKLTPAQEIAETLDNIEKHTFHNKNNLQKDVDEIFDKTQQIRKELKGGIEL